MNIHFTVPAVPVAQPRPRATAFGGHAQMYTPTNSAVNAFKAAVQQAFKSQYNGPPLEGPLGLTLTFVMPRTKGMMWKTKPMPRTWYDKGKNDWDNLGKSSCDALNKIAWRDDGQLCEVLVRRLIAAGDEAPHVEIEIDALTSD